MKRMIINFVIFQLGWFGCVLGAANGYPLLGPVIVLGAVALHLASSERPHGELFLVLAAGLIGAVFDTLLVRTGWLEYPNGILLAGTAPYWIVAMWMLFATTLNVSMQWLRGRWMLACALGALGGPLSYLAGARLGGLTFLDSTAALTALAAGWGLAMPVLVALAKRLDGARPMNKVATQNV